MPIGRTHCRRAARARRRGRRDRGRHLGAAAGVRAHRAARRGARRGAGPGARRGGERRHARSPRASSPSTCRRPRCPSTARGSTSASRWRPRRRRQGLGRVGRAGRAPRRAGARRPAASGRRRPARGARGRARRLRHRDGADGQRGRGGAGAGVAGRSRSRRCATRRSGTAPNSSPSRSSPLMPVALADPVERAPRPRRRDRQRGRGRGDAGRRGRRAPPLPARTARRGQDDARVAAARHPARPRPDAGARGELDPLARGLPVGAPARGRRSRRRTTPRARGARRRRQRAHPARRRRAGRARGAVPRRGAGVRAGRARRAAPAARVGRDHDPPGERGRAFPARFQLVLAANPCPCGKYGARDADCTCPPSTRRRYLGRLCGPLLDRIDIQLNVPRITAAQLRIGDERPTTELGCGARPGRRGARACRRAPARARRGGSTRTCPASWLRGAGRRRRARRDRRPRPRARTRRHHDARLRPRAAARVDARRPRRRRPARRGPGRPRTAPEEGAAHEHRRNRGGGGRAARAGGRRRASSTRGRRGAVRAGGVDGMAEPGDRDAGVAHRRARRRRGAGARRSRASSADELAAELDDLPASSIRPSSWTDALARWTPRPVSTPTAARAAAGGAVRGAAARARRCDWPAQLDDLGAHAPFALWVRGDARRARVARAVDRARRGARGDRLRRARHDGGGERARRSRVRDRVRRRLRHRRHGAPCRARQPRHDGRVSRRRRRPLLPGGHERCSPASSTAGASSPRCRRVAPTKWRFLQRNRLIAAASSATVVVEAGWRSGSLNTAGHAATLGRPLGAVPGTGHERGLRGMPPAAARVRGDLRHRRRRDGRTRPVATGSVRGRRHAPARRAGATRPIDRSRLRVLDAAQRPPPRRDRADRAGCPGSALDRVRAELGLLELEGLVRGARALDAADWREPTEEAARVVFGA